MKYYTVNFAFIVMVLPEQDAVVVITSESIATKTTMQLVWDLLVPAMTADPLPPNATERNGLRTDLKDIL